MPVFDIGKKFSDAPGGRIPRCEKRVIVIQYTR